MKVLIIGGTGFVGLEVTKQLQTAGHSVTLFHRKPSAEFPVNQIQGDCNNTNDLRACLRQTAPDLVIHTTAMNRPQIASLENSFEAPTRVVILSSADVYQAFEVFNKLSDAPIKQVPLSETAPLRKTLHFCRYQGYDYEKIEMETASLESPLIEPIILRLGMVFGPNDPNRRFYNIIEASRSGALTLPANVAAWKTCYAGVMNVAHGIVLAAERGQIGEIYNLADKEVFTELEWHGKIAGLIKRKVEISVSAENSETGNFAQNLLLDTTKIRRDLGYSERFTAEEHLLKMINSEPSINGQTSN